MESRVMQERKLVSAVVECLPEDISERTIEDLVGNHEKLKAILKMAFCPPGSMVYWPKVWKAIALGGVLTPLEALAATVDYEVVAKRFYAILKSAGVMCEDLLKDMKYTELSSALRESWVNLVLVTPREVGFHIPPVSSDFYDAATGKGLEICPTEVAPQLRRQYVDQPEDETVCVAMKPICVGFYCLPTVFALRKNDGVNKLGMACAVDIPLDQGFVFIKPR